MCATVSVSNIRLRILIAVQTAEGVSAHHVGNLTMEGGPQSGDRSASGTVDSSFAAFKGPRPWQPHSADRSEAFVLWVVTGVRPGVSWGQTVVGTTAPPLWHLSQDITVVHDQICCTGRVAVDLKWLCGGRNYALFSDAFVAVHPQVSHDIWSISLVPSFLRWTVCWFHILKII
jgi:hypothetical protein